MSGKQYSPFDQVTLDEVVKDVCIELFQTTDTHHYERFMRFAERGARDLAFDVAKGHKEVDFVLDDLRRAPLPDDYVGYVGIGRRHEGLFVPLHYSPRILLTMSRDNCGNNEPHPMITDALSNYTYVRNGQSTGRVYGQQGGDDEAYFNIDRENQLIIFSAPGPFERGEQLVLRYKSDGISTNTTVHKYSAEALIEFIHWRRIKGNPKSTRGERQDAKRDWQDAKSRARLRMSRFSITDLIQAIRNTQSLANNT